MMILLLMMRTSLMTSNPETLCDSKIVGAFIVPVMLIIIQALTWWSWWRGWRWGRCLQEGKEHAHWARRLLNFLALLPPSNCPLYLDINVIFCFVSFVPKCCLCGEKKITFGIPCNILVEKRALEPEIGVFQFAKHVVTKHYPKAPWLLCYSRFQKVFHVLVVLPKWRSSIICKITFFAHQLSFLVNV